MEVSGTAAENGLFLGFGVWNPHGSSKNPTISGWGGGQTAPYLVPASYLGAEDPGGLRRERLPCRFSPNPCRTAHALPGSHSAPQSLRYHFKDRLSPAGWLSGPRSSSLPPPRGFGSGTPIHCSRPLRRSRTCEATLTDMEHA